MRGGLPRLACTLAIALAGVVMFARFGLPLPWLLGPMFACILSALGGITLKGAPRTSAMFRTVLGVAVGASITPALVDGLGDIALSVALIPPFTLLVGLTGYPYFRRLWRFDRATAYYAAMPGGLQDMLVFGEEAGGSPRALGLIHATRLLIIVTGLPLLLSHGFGVDLSNPPGIPAVDLPVHEGLLMVILALAGWWLARRVGLFGASILGPMILAAAASLAGLLDNRPPAEAILASQFFIGLSVGVQYTGIRMAEIRRVVASAVGYTVLLGLLALLFASVVTELELAPALDAALAFSPGGQAEMTVLAIVAGADIAYVVTHHIARIVLVIIGAPLLRRLLR